MNDDGRDYIGQQARQLRRHFWRRAVARVLILPALGGLGAVTGVAIQAHNTALAVGLGAICLATWVGVVLLMTEEWW